MPENLIVFRKFVWKAIINCTKDTASTYPTYESIKSPVFEVPVGGEITKWFLRLYPNDKSSPSHMGLYFYRSGDSKIHFNINFFYYIIGKSGKLAGRSMNASSDEFNGRGGVGTDLLSHENYDKLFDELVVEGNFEVCCEILISALDSKPSPSFSILQNIQRMYDDDSFKDFELKCNDHQNLLCHKAILATQSPVFRAMLTNDVKETNQGFVEVPDFDSVVMTEVLRFMYGFPAENLENIAEELIFAAEKYDLDDLKQICIEKIAEKLSKDNVIQTLVISDKVSGCERLFQRCIVAVVRNFAEISKTPEWAELSNSILTKVMNATVQMISSVNAERID